MSFWRMKKEENSSVKVSSKKEVPKEAPPKKVVQEENGVKTWNNLLEYEIKKSSTETYVVITGFSKKNTSVHEINIPQSIEGYPVREVKIVQR